MIPWNGPFKFNNFSVPKFSFFRLALLCFIFGAERDNEAANWLSALFHVRYAHTAFGVLNAVAH